MTTKTATSALQAYKTLRARRHRAEAEIRAVDAQRAAQLAAAEAEHAEREAAQQQAQARTAELSAELDKTDAFLADLRRQQEQAAQAEEARKRDLLERARAFIDEPPPRVRRPLEEHQADLAQLGAYVDSCTEAEREGRRAYVDRAESQRLWDHAFRARWDYHHPGGLDGGKTTDVVTLGGDF